MILCPRLLAKTLFVARRKPSQRKRRQAPFPISIVFLSTPRRRDALTSRHLLRDAFPLRPSVPGRLDVTSSLAVGRGEGKMIPPVEVSPLIKFGRYSALLIGIVYGKKRYDYLKPIAEEERRIEAEEKKKREEMERIAKALAEGIFPKYSPSFKFKNKLVCVCI
uniref:ATP synthase F(0) complex subunit e, mitochondrial n=1 Tax=Podarcis muralis TaxID=64176 RepID=A0A670JZZ7_PODMU